MDHLADHGEQPRPVPSHADRLAHLHALVDEYVACGHQLRTLHERYMALQHEGMSHERREKYQQLLHAELALLAKAQHIQQELDRVLRENLEILRSSGVEGAHRSDMTPQV